MTKMVVIADYGDLCRVQIVMVVESAAGFERNLERLKIVIRDVEVVRIDCVCGDFRKAFTNHTTAQIKRVAAKRYGRYRAH